MDEEEQRDYYTEATQTPDGNCPYDSTDSCYDI
jgi:hypothetical protein